MANLPRLLSNSTSALCLISESIPTRCLVALFSRFSAEKQSQPQESTERVAASGESAPWNFKWDSSHNSKAPIELWISFKLYRRIRRLHHGWFFCPSYFFCSLLLFFYCRMFWKVDWPNPLSSSSPSHPLFYPPSSSHFRVTHTHTHAHRSS